MPEARCALITGWLVEALQAVRDLGQGRERPAFVAEGAHAHGLKTIRVDPCVCQMIPSRRSDSPSCARVAPVASRSSARCTARYC